MRGACRALPFFSNFERVLTQSFQNFMRHPCILSPSRRWLPLWAGLLFWGLPRSFSNACVPYPERFEGYSFLRPDLFLNEQQWTPYFLDFSKALRARLNPEREQEQGNLEEWRERFCDSAPIEHIRQVVYETTLRDLEELKSAVRNKNLPLPKFLKGNRFAQHLKRNRCAETAEYLHFAKRCEPYVTLEEPWRQTLPQREAMHALIEEGRGKFLQPQSQYIRLRYAYQLVRLAHYARDYEKTLELYDFLMPKIDPETSRMEDSILPYWILGHKAGALRALGRNVEASYLYALIFGRCPSKRESAFRSFLIRSDEEWAACLRLCESDAERIFLYALRAHQRDAHAVEEMREIYALDPASPFLEPLLAREIAKLERHLLGTEFNDKRRRNRRRFGVPADWAGPYVVDVQAFAGKVAREGRVPRPHLWRLAQGYLAFLAGNYYDARHILEEVLESISEEELQKQARAFLLALRIAAFENPNPTVEQAAYDIIKDEPLYREFRDFPDFLRDRMTFLYQKNGHPGKAFLCQYPLTALRPNPPEHIPQDLLELAQKREHSLFERLLIHRAQTNNFAHDLWDIRATLHFRRYNLEAALEAFREIPHGQWDDYGVFNPFLETLDDCVFCSRQADTAQLMNKGEIVQELLDLEYKAKSDFERSAEYLYRIGLAYYNMSYFGYAWEAMDYFRSGASWYSLHRRPDRVFPTWQFPFGNYEHLDVSQALYYFQRAYDLAKDPELAAKAAFMAARCEQKLYFTSPEYTPEPCCNRIPQIPEQYLNFFYLLKERFDTTQFYQRAIRECKYFAAFAKK